MVGLMIRLGAEKGFKYACSYVIDARSRHLFKKYGCEDWAELDTREAVIGG